MSVKDVNDRADLLEIITRFYQSMLKDPIIGFIFTDVVKIELERHLPIIVDFWDDILFSHVQIEKQYTGNPLQKHLEISQKLPLTSGHFTRWLFLFNQAVDERHAGDNVDRMKARAEMVASSISAAITKRKRGDMTLSLDSQVIKDR